MEPSLVDYHLAASVRFDPFQKSELTSIAWTGIFLAKNCLPGRTKSNILFRRMIHCLGSQESWVLSLLHKFVLTLDKSFQFVV